MIQILVPDLFYGGDTWPNKTMLDSLHVLFKFTFLFAPLVAIIESGMVFAPIKFLFGLMESIVSHSMITFHLFL